MKLLSAYDIAQLLDPPRTPRAVYDALQRLQIAPAAVTKSGRSFYDPTVVEVVAQSLRAANATEPAEAAAV